VYLIVSAGGNATARSTKQATHTIPIVITNVIDPVESGFIASLARPGANITGLAIIGSDLTGKRLELVQETFPNASHIAAVLDPEDPAKITELKEAQAAKALGLNCKPSKYDAPATFKARSKLWSVSAPGLSSCCKVRSPIRAENQSQNLRQRTACRRFGLRAGSWTSVGLCLMGQTTPMSSGARQPTWTGS
jgi:hypothetical protein